MTFESWDDAMFWHGSLIGYMAGVKSACKDEDKSNLLLRMADTQARLEFMESENAKLRELARDMFDCISHANEQDWFYFERDESGCGMSCTVNGEDCGLCVLADRMRELGVEV